VSAIVDAGFFSGPVSRRSGTACGDSVFAGRWAKRDGKSIMLGRHVYRVRPTEQGWTVTKEGEDHPRDGFSGREDAIAEAVRLAGSDEPAKVTIDNGDGTIAEERLFGTDLVEELRA
jgi:hypothetical protein